MNFRQVHLDFHTSEKIPGIGSKYDKKQFQKALQIGHINSITLFAKCHHGWMYYPSKVGKPHPQLQLNLLQEQIEAAHEIGVKTPVYISAGLDEQTARAHPEWVIRREDESTTWCSRFSRPGYHRLCMNSPYLDLLKDEVIEVCKTFDADGIFMDIVGVEPCYCQNCIRILEGEGVDPYDPNNIQMLAERTYKKYHETVRAAIDSVKLGLPLFHNTGHIQRGRRDLAFMNTHLELESLPTGGWGYDHFPESVRYAQGLGMDVVGMTGKFHETWGEFGGFKHPNALRYEAALSVANGAKCSIGDQLAPNGHMDEVTYRLIGKAYSEVEEKEPWLDEVTSIADIGVLSCEAWNSEKKKADDGVTRILLEGHYLFDILDSESDFSKYKVIILPDCFSNIEKLVPKLREFIQNGGKLLASGSSGLNSETGTFDFDFGAEWVESMKYQPAYLHPRFFYEEVENTDYVIYSGGECVKGKNEEAILADIISPYFNRSIYHFCSHKHAPASGEVYGAAMTEGKDGIYIAFSVFTEYATWGNLISKNVVRYALDRLLGEHKTVRTDLPAQGIVTLMHQKQEHRFVCHLLYASPVRRGDNIEVIEDIVPLYGIYLDLKTECLPKRVYLAPSGDELNFEYSKGRLLLTVPKIDCHAMIVIEY